MIKQGVEKHNSLVLAKTKEVSIRVTGSLTTINDKQFLQREADARRQIFDLCLKLAVLKWCKLVEQRLNHGGIDCNHNHLEHDPKLDRGANINTKLFGA